MAAGEGSDSSAAASRRGAAAHGPGPRAAGRASVALEPPATDDERVDACADEHVVLRERRKPGRLAAAAELRKVSGPKYFAFILLAIFIQINWGLYGVCSRYLQVRAGRMGAGFL